MTKAFIFGNGGHARVIASLIDCDVTFIDRPDEEEFFRRVDDYRSDRIYLGVGNDLNRRRIFEKLRSLGISASSCIAPTAFVARTVMIGDGTVICPGAVIMTGAKIGSNVIVNTLSSVDHDSVVGDHTQITVGVTIPGCVRVGQQCFFGVKSATFPGISIGNRVIVRGGSLVVKDVPDGVVVGGQPARVIRAASET